MKTYDETWNSLLERRDRHYAAQKKKRKIWITAVSSLCVVALVGVALWQGLKSLMPPPVIDNGEPSQSDTTATTGTTEPTPPPTTKPALPNYKILWGQESPAQDAVNSDGQEYGWVSNKYGKNCGSLLTDLFLNIEENVEDKIAFFVKSYDYQSTLFHYQVDGKDIATYKTAADNHRALVKDLESIVRNKGETSFVDKELLRQYFDGDVFLEDQAEFDWMLAKSDNSARQAYDIARKMYQQYAAVQMKGQLEKRGFDCYYTEGAEYVMFFATQQEFASLSLGKAEDHNWIYDWATEPLPMLACGNTDHTYVHNGKTVHQYYMEWWESTYPEEKFYNLIKEEGELLKHGEDLYLGTDPNGDPWLDLCGVPWTKQTYETCVAYYGEGMLSKYIVDGEFLKDLAQADWDAAKKKYEEAGERYEEACIASQQNGTVELKKKLEELGYACEYTEDKKEVIFYISAQEYENLSWEITENCVFKWVTFNENETIRVPVVNA